ncbi:three-helix bundle dimerization domain-containing protein [Microbacterium deminutum]|uniref:Uncharacterized protein n=1 Tax=Microbacterium deminutum TaxID=344164 RepID=A0ABP5BE27_9MICO
MTRDAINEDAAIEDVIERLAERFPRLPHAQIVDAVYAARDSFARAQVRDFVPVLVEREARARLEHPI